MQPRWTNASGLVFHRHRQQRSGKKGGHLCPGIKIWGIAIGVAACVFGTAAAFAQDTPARVRGTFDKMDGNNLTIQTRSGKETTVTLKDGAPVVAVTKGAMSDIKSNTFVGITAMAQPDGTIKAVEVHVFEE